MQNRDGQKKYDQMTPAQERYMNIMYDFFQLADKSGDDGAVAAIKNDSDSKIDSQYVNQCHRLLLNNHKNPYIKSDDLPRYLHNYPLFYLHVTPEQIKELKKDDVVSTLHELIQKFETKKGISNVWTYIIVYNHEKKRIYARFTPVWGFSELTTKHAFLYKLFNYKKENIDVLAAGELKIKDKIITINTLSGTFFNHDYGRLNIVQNYDSIIKPEIDHGRPLSEIKSLLDPDIYKQFSSINQNTSKSDGLQIIRNLFKNMIPTLFRDIYTLDGKYSIGLRESTKDYEIIYDNSLKTFISNQLTYKEAKQITYRINYKKKVDEQYPFYLLKNSEDCQLIDRYFQWNYLKDQNEHSKTIFDYFAVRVSNIEHYNLTTNRFYKPSIITDYINDDFQLNGFTIDDQWIIGKQLGRGAFGTTYSVINKITRENVAMKIMPFFSMKPLNLEIIANYKKMIEKIIMYFKRREWLMIANTHQFAENIYLPKLTIKEQHKLLSDRKIEIPLPKLFTELLLILKTNAFRDFYDLDNIFKYCQFAESIKDDRNDQIDFNFQYLIMPKFKYTVIYALELNQKTSYSMNDIKTFGYQLLRKMKQIYKTSYDRFKTQLISHNDIKPANIMFNNFTENPTLIDWGVASQSLYTRRAKEQANNGTLSWQSPWIMEGGVKYDAIILDDLISVGFVLCLFIDIDIRMYTKDEKLQFFRNLESNDKFTRSNNFIKEYMLACFQEHNRLIETEKSVIINPTGKDEICDRLINILKPGWFW